MNSTLVSIHNSNDFPIKANRKNSKLYKGQVLNCQVSGKYHYVETAEHHVFIIGAIQDNEFNSSTDQASYFQALKLTEQVKKFNGHFSVVLINKVTNEFLLYTNKLGGSRIYLKQTEFGWQVTDKLKPLLSKSEQLNKTALKEVFYYRWITGENSLIENIAQIPSAHYWKITDNKIAHKECYYFLPAYDSKKHTEQSLDEHEQHTSMLLTTALNSMLHPKKKIAVLLSGGVDSSILAALAKEAGHHLVAISHRSVQHDNPELVTAIEFAQTLNIEHRIIDIDDNEIAEAFKLCTTIIEQPPRFQSSIILYLLFAKLAGEFSQVIYGEAADTFFGNGKMKRYIHRYNKKQKLLSMTKNIPFFNFFRSLLPSKNKINLLLSEDINTYIKEIYQLELNELAINKIDTLVNPTERLYSYSRLDLINTDEKTTNLTDDILRIKRFSVDTTIDNHFHETSAIADYFGLELISPFADYEIIEYSAQLSEAQSINSDYVKPILRKVGERFFEPSLMYLPKKGFPAPHLEWLNNCLKSYVDEGVSSLKFPIANTLDPESQWTLAALNILLKDFNIDFNIAK